MADTVAENMDDDCDDKDDTKRRTRNLSEKKRRDQFNSLVNELGTMISGNNRKMDKSTILRSTISFLKNHNEITVRSRVHDIHEDWKPAFLSNEEFTYLVLEALEAFVMVFSASGHIYYVSESVSSLLGHNPADVVDKSIFDLVFNDEGPLLYGLLQNHMATVDSMRRVTSHENELTFQCHFKRGTLDFRDEDTYELIQFNGHFTTNIDVLENNDSPGSNIERDRMLFVCTGRLFTPQFIRDVSLVDSNRSEFTSRHSLENFHFLFLDHRAPPIIGYLPLEVLGTSGYDYYHFDDMEKVVNCHEALMQKGERTSCYYRFLTKGQQWIWLQTRFYISYHQWNSKPEFVVCTHRVVSYEDLCRSMKRAVIDTNAPSKSTNSGKLSERTMNEGMTSTVSPSYISENSEQFGSSYQHLSQPTSVKSASGGSTVYTVSTVGTPGASVASWSRATHTRHGGSDTTSMSGESRSSQRRNSWEARTEKAHALVPQHCIGAHYLEPSAYVSAVSLPGVLPSPIQPVPVIVSSDQSRLQCHRPMRQGQLQRKHEELQEMIVRQQEELRQVKEQLLLARLGILPPLINVQTQYVNAGDVHQPGQRVPAQIICEDRPAPTGYPQEQQHPHLPQ